MIKSAFIIFSKILINQKKINNIQYVTVNSDLMEYRYIVNDRKFTLKSLGYYVQVKNCS